MNAKTQEAIAEAVVVTLTRALKPLRDELAQLATEIAALKVQPKGLTYGGAWQRAMLYHRHEGTTFKGQLWVCVADVSRGNEPGSSPDWQLAQKDAG
jgi:hypothetical protein